MKRLMSYVLLAAGVSMLFLGCANESSTEACRHEVTMNLDKGNFDAVLGSSCAGSMQRGAANLGLAGFDSTDVINRLIQTQTGDTGGKNDISFYMTALVGKVTSESLISINEAKTAYEEISNPEKISPPPACTTDPCKDANFYISIVDTVKTLSLLKTVIDASGLGTLNATCDANGNTTPDEIDATACALLVSANQTCPPAGGTTVQDTNPVVNFKKADGSSITGTYRGLAITVSGTGTNISGCPKPNKYNKLLYQPANTSQWVAVTTEAGTPACPDGNGTKWPCPILGSDGLPIDLVNALTQTLDSATDAIGAALPTGSTDVQTAITDIKNSACPTGTCTSQNIADYLQTIKN